jgi:hypothetical protein
VFKVEKELQINPLKFGDSFTMTRRTEDRYLGMYLHEGGTAASVAATVGKRTGKFKGAAFEIRSVIEEFSMQAMGGMMAAKVLLERALLPSLMSGACNWIGVKKVTEEECDIMIYLYWRIMFKVPEGTPKVALLAETATMRTRWRIWEAKILMVMRLQKQDVSSLARQVYEQQLALGWPGLAKEVSEICATIGLRDVNYYKVEKEKVQEMIFFHHYKDLKEELDKSQKMEGIKHEDYRVAQSYIGDKSIERCRTKFRIRINLMKTFKDNFRTKYRQKERGQEDSDPGLQCSDCPAQQTRDTQAHCLTCPAWQHVRVGLDLEDIEDIVTYFQRVLEGRSKKGRGPTE